MAIVGIGVDVTSVERIRKVWERNGDRFLEKVFHDGEILSRRGDAFHEHVAGRFAAKEAAMKALGTGWGRGVGWKSLRVDRARGGPPRLVLLERAEELARSRGVTATHLSITHGGGVAVAVVVLEATGGDTA